MNICITRSRGNPYSETFIRNQINGLADYAKVFSIYSGRLPEKDETGKILSPLPFWLAHKALKSVIGRNNYFSHYGIRKFLIDNQIDVVLSNFGFSATHMLPICQSLNIPLIAHFHGYDASGYKILKQYAAAYQKLFNHATAIICVSTEMKSRLISMGANQEKIHNIPYGIDIDKFYPGPNNDRPPSSFLSVGRFVPKKAPLLSIKAFEKVWKDLPSARLTMIGGGGKLFEECRHFVRQHNMDKVVNLVGALPPDQIVSYMQEAQIFLQHSITPSTGDMEGTPNSILEAGACGLPVVSTFHGGIKDAVIHGKTGFLVNEGDVNGMAQYMKKLMEEKHLAKEMGDAAREHILLNYNHHEQIKKLFEVIQSVLPEKE